MENKAYEHIIGTPDARFATALAARCGLATSFTATAHPSLPNYIALASGGTQGVIADVDPPMSPLPVPSIFSQLGTDWRSLAESMTSDCQGVGDVLYTPTHNPALYFTDLAAVCAQQVVPLTSPPDLSARFTLIVPNKCSDTGDQWLSSEVTEILDTPEYRSGTTALLITWDEADGGLSQHVATLVIAPSTPAGTQDATPYTHYSMLRTTEEMLGLPLLGNAATATSMRGGFGL